MTVHTVTREEVVSGVHQLPSFPVVVNQILATLDDPDANLNVLVSQIEHDPIIAARVLSLANNAATRTRQKSDVYNIYSATTLVGIGRVREMALLSSISKYAEQFGGAVPDAFWRHSVGVGVCGIELAHHTDAASPSATLIAGLLHDIGQMWLYCFRTLQYRRMIQSDIGCHDEFIDVEAEMFGADHSMIGSWLAEHWLLPMDICQAIRFHHQPEKSLDNPLVPLIHVAEVIGNALGLSGLEGNHVRTISTAACNELGLVLDSSSHSLFGCIEARSRHANQLFYKD